MNPKITSLFDEMDKNLNECIYRTKLILNIADELNREMKVGLKEFADEVIEATDGNADVVYAFNHALKERGV